MQYIPVIEYDSAIKRNEIEINAAIWMNLEKTLNETQTKMPNIV